MPDRRPNILCFVTDQLRADHLGCYGNSQVSTPNINSLASEGILFTESYVANPVCMPNRASFFTGQFPKVHGVRENGIALSPNQNTLPKILSDAGYQTASIGKLHLAPFGTKRESVRSDWELYESKEFWDSGGDIPRPFYGFEDVCLVDGHGPYVFGHYKRWLDANFPHAYEKLSITHALEPPTGARECWKASIQPELHYNTFIADRTIEWLRRRNTDKPFFLWCSFPDPHHPYSPPRPYCDMYKPSDIDFHPARREGELDDLPEYFRLSYEGALVTGGLRGDLRKTTDDHYREIIALTYGMITMVDHQIGRIIAELQQQSLLDNTIIVFLSDHGDLMGDHWLINKGPYLYRGLVRVPTIWRMPGAANSGSVCDALVSAVDLCPTLLDLVGLPIPEEVQGFSYRRLLEGEQLSIRDAVYIEFDETYIGDRLRSIRTKEWALTAHANRTDGLLFDLKNDPRELYNLWNEPKFERIKSDLLFELFRQTAKADSWLPAKLSHA